MKNDPDLPVQQQALEYLLGQILWSIETDSIGVRAQLQRLEDAVKRIAPARLAQPGEEEECSTPFTLDSLGAHMQACLERMRAHQHTRAQQMVAIGQLTERVLLLGGLQLEAAPPEAGETAQRAPDQAARRKPEA